MKRSFGIFLLVVLLATSCSRKKNTSLSRAYHNTTSRYNGYFNARELMKEKDIELRTTLKEDYSQLLPIFIYPTESQSQAMYPDMDKVIEKCSEVIERHSIYKRGKEYIKWIDDSYFLIGKARLYKEELGLAESTFLYVYQNYKKDPARYNGLNWIIKTFIQTEQWDRAEDFLDIAEDNLRKYPEEHLGHLYAIYADYNIKKDKDYEKAIENLEKAIELTKKKEPRRRYTYILAQLYQKNNNLLLATEKYTQVLKMNPSYKMRFNARISRAIAYDVKGADSKAIKKELNKMLRDVKNEDFRDQIYYALAEIAIKEQDEPLAIAYLKKSTKFSVSNKKQKALSFLRLADIYFEQPSYIAAQEHYDSTLQFLPEEHPEYYPTEDKNNNLQELVKNLKIIKLQDSLLTLSNLSSADREKKVEKIIKKLKEEEERKKQAELQKLREAQNQASSGLTNVTGGSRGKGRWYFYNPNTRAIGVGGFINKWGNVVLEDNWRRKNKASSTIAQNTGETKEQISKQDPESENKKYNPEFYLKNIPKDYKGQLIAHSKISEALFNVGTIFKESFTDYTSAIGSFERVVKEYDTSRYNLPAHYQLYRIYKINEYDEKAEIEKKWVLDNHPFSEYAYLIKDPNYNKQSKETKEKVEEFYVATYKLYRYGLYNDVVSSCEKADNTFSVNYLKAKFDLLKAQAIGHSKPKLVFKSALEAVVEDHPKTPEQKKASEILAFLKQKPKAKGTSKSKTTVTYKHNPKSKHIFILSAKVNKGSNFSILKNKLSDFNKQYFRESNLTVTQSALQNKSIYLVRTFDNEELAIRYIRALKNNTQLSSIIRQFNAKQYLISNENFRKLFQSKEEDEYLKFFNKEYPI
ncbi:MAG: tetratricopeptide repeat protein [Flavobacteriales bacterium]|nr:tetratricopeptide repeat protein [Flavobacteriales bacterium]